eukprot:Nitzschia sp. Nitz4//scaffold88_size82704//41110//41784//NITZ4_005294-RA/size82704-processed-gene-0.102-mRNA-1//1//CDS//3329559500//6183//frame0
MTSTFISQFPWTSTLAALPVLLWAQDSLFSLHVVRGSSMEPTLHSGDILVVRKSDGIWQRYPQDRVDPERKMQQQHQHELEFSYCHGPPNRGWLLQKPPMPIEGDVIVFKDPSEYPWRYSIKRIVGLGHQIVMMPSNRYKQVSPYRMPDDKSSTTFRVASASVPPYSFWVEGDNVSNSLDSTTSHGAVSKKLLVGVAEYRIWPPTRIGKVGDERPEPKPYSYWP